jgi:F-type H+-transporting ATPase subunit b
MTRETYEAIAVWSEVVASVLFIAAMIWIFRKYIAPAVTKAEAQKNAELVEAERRRNEAREQVSISQRNLEAAKTEVTAILARAASDAQRERDRILADARVDGERLINNADGELTRGRAAGRESYRDALLQDALRLAGEKAAREVDGRADTDIINRVLGAIDENVAAA